jgi:hypothetical protein
MIHVFQRDFFLSQLVHEECLQANTATLRWVTGFISDVTAYWGFVARLNEKKENKHYKRWNS